MQHNDQIMDEVVPTVLGFSPDFTRFEYITRVFYFNMVSKATSNPWFRFVSELDFVAYCRCAALAYGHITHNEVYGSAGLRTESVGKLTSTFIDITIPTFVLDMIREVYRPMYFGLSTSVIAYEPLDKHGMGIVPGLGWNSTFSTISHLLRSNSFGVSMSPLVAERPGKSPLFISTDKSFAYSNGSSCPDFRLESVDQLRFLRPRSTLWLASNTIRRTPTSNQVPSVISLNKIELEAVHIPPDRTYDDPTFSPDTDVLIYDAIGKPMSMATFVLADQHTIDLAPKVTIDGVEYQQRVTPPPVQFNYGSFGKEHLHAIVRSLNPTDAELATREMVRSRLTIGNAFRFEVVASLAPMSLRFPSDKNPSREGFTTLGAKPNLGKTRRKEKRKEKSEKSKDLAELPSTMTLSKKSDDAT